MPNITETFTREKFVDDLGKLVSFRTINKDDVATRDQAPFDEAMNFIREQIDPRAHVEVQTHENAQFLLAGNTRGKNPDICYLVHVDVVPVAEGNEHQFEMKVDGDMAIGRGASDMKFSIPLGYALLNELIERNSDIKFILAITSDEESGGFKGAEYLANEYKLTPNLLIVPDGGENFTLVNKAKGVCQIKVNSIGKSAHSSRPWHGESALDPLIAMMNELKRRYDQNNRQEGWHTTMNIGRLDVGNKVTNVPEKGEMRLDFRFPPETDSIEALVKQVTTLAHEIDPRLLLEVTATGVATYVNIEHPDIRLFTDVMEQRLGREIEVEAAYGSTDARHFNKQGAGAPFIMTKPDGRGNHGPDERIDISSVMTFYKILSDYLLRYEAQHSV